MSKIEYEFQYRCWIKLPSGRRFKRIGVIKAIHARDAKIKVKELHSCGRVSIKAMHNNSVAGIGNAKWSFV